MQKLSQFWGRLGLLIKNNFHKDKEFLDLFKKKEAVSKIMKLLLFSKKKSSILLLFFARAILF